jgi:hypothetical protein
VELSALERPPSPRFAAGRGAARPPHAQVLIMTQQAAATAVAVLHPEPVPMRSTTSDAVLRRRCASRREAGPLGRQFD